MTERFVSLAKAVQIGGFTAGNIAQWRVKYPHLANSEYFSPPVGKARAAQVSRSGVIFFAIVGTLIRRGLPLPAAAEAAWQFTDAGDSMAPGREPCEFYPEPQQTLLLVAPTVDGGYRVRVVSSDRDALFINLLTTFRSEVLMIVNLNALVARVDAALADNGGEETAA